MSAAPQTTMPKNEVSEAFFIHIVDGKEVEAIRIGLKPDGTVDLSGLAGKRDDLKESYEKFGLPQPIGPTVFPKDGARFLKAMLFEARRSPYIIFRPSAKLS